MPDRVTLSAPVRTGDSETLARIHAAAFEDAWSAAAIAQLSAQPGVFALLAPPDAGFILVRVTADEAEILTLATHPASRRRGIGRQLTGAGAALAAQRGAARIFLEVNVGNFAAQALYAGLGFAEVGRRPGYYRRNDGVKEDALVLRADLPLLETRNKLQPSVVSKSPSRRMP